MSDKHKTKEEYIRNAKANIPTLSKEHEKHLAYMWEHYYLIPLGKDTSEIPKGDYCYKFVEGKNEYGIPNIKSCPYRSGKVLNGATIAWCNYLELGGLLNEAAKDGDYERILEFFGDEETTWNYLPLDLLFDDVKECGVNKYTPEEEDEMYGDPDSKKV